MNNFKCIRCHTEKNLSNFGKIISTGLPTKTCLPCLENQKKHRQKTRCSRGRADPLDPSLVEVKKKYNHKSGHCPCICCQEIRLREGIVQGIVPIP